MLPRLSKKKVDAIISEAQDAEYKLEFVPTTTIEYVNSLVFLDEIQERVSWFLCNSLFKTLWEGRQIRETEGLKVKIQLSEYQKHFQAKEVDGLPHSSNGS